ncbi:uncharacterized protein LOC111397919 [Olea europaea var. sylvestris]|uniref:uncharacterized protein LOC111397919 n=1 Tax=Olea europaea var. sylvestris TaxID=158386 RepID=UPI000C1D1117|nr:uncharacterized protein LOC111397919 [Olea europaea var. sylvestris]
MAASMGFSRAKEVFGKVATSDSNFNFHPKCAQLKITHLTFADDFMLFARGDVMSLDILLNCLSIFGGMLGLNINVGKSCIYTMGIHGKDLEDILALTNLPIGSMPFRYLDIPLAVEKLKVGSYDVGLSLCEPCFKVWNVFGFLYSLSRLRMKKQDSPLIKKLVDIRDSIIAAQSDGILALDRLCSWTVSGNFPLQQLMTTSDRRGDFFSSPERFGMVPSLPNTHLFYG